MLSTTKRLQVNRHGFLLATAVLLLMLAESQSSTAATWSVNVFGLTRDISTYQDESILIQSIGFLGGLSTGNGFIARTGDTIHAILRLDQAWRVPASTEVTSINLGLSSDRNPPDRNNSNALVTTQLLLNGQMVREAVAGVGGSNQITGSGFWTPPLNTEFSFDEAIFDITSITLDRGLVVDRASVYMVLTAPVPEPATCILALTGMGCGGISIWRRRRRTQHPSQGNCRWCVALVKSGAIGHISSMP